MVRRLMIDLYILLITIPWMACDELKKWVSLNKEKIGSIISDENDFITGVAGFIGMHSIKTT